MTKKHEKMPNGGVTETGDAEENTQQDQDSARRRTLLKAGWALPVVTMVPLPQESAMAQTGGSHIDSHGDHTDSGSHNDVD